MAKILALQVAKEWRYCTVLVIIEHQTRRIVYCMVTTYPAAARTLQQLREAFSSDHVYRFLIHDGDGIFSPQLDRSTTPTGLRILRTPPRSPKANCLCERVIGTLRRERLDFLIPLIGHHFNITTRQWVAHFNRGRFHSNLGPGTADLPVDLPVTPHKQRHCIPSHCTFVARPVLDGLHYENGLLAKAA